MVADIPGCLPSGYYENQVWGALHKAWVGYNIAISKWEFDNTNQICKNNTQVTKGFRFRII